MLVGVDKCGFFFTQLKIKLLKSFANLQNLIGTIAKYWTDSGGSCAIILLILDISTYL